MQGAPQGSNFHNVATTKWFVVSYRQQWPETIPRRNSIYTSIFWIFGKVHWPETIPRRIGNTMILWKFCKHNVAEIIPRRNMITIPMITHQKQKKNDRIIQRKWKLIRYVCDWQVWDYINPHWDRKTIGNIAFSRLQKSQEQHGITQIELQDILIIIRTWVIWRQLGVSVDYYARIITITEPLS